MFKANPDAMRMEPTPERVLSVCRMTARGPLTRAALRAALALEKDIDNAIDRSIDVALEELDLLRTKDHRLELAVPPEVIASPEAFRRYAAAAVFHQSNTTFTMFTRWLIAQNHEIFALRSWEVMGKTCAAQVSELSFLDENNVLGWRFWAAFLGLGYLNRTMFLPNMKTRLQDILATSFSASYPYGETIRATDFVEWLSGTLPEADLTGRLPLAVSAGLHTLHELGLIHLDTWRDSNRVMLFYVDGERINDFSHITVYKEVCR